MTDFATLTNAQINGFAGRRDPRFAEWADKTRDENMPGYSTSASVALALLGRWGYTWERHKLFCGPMNVTVYTDHHSASCIESPTCDFTRALMNAACALKESGGV